MRAVRKLFVALAVAGGSAAAIAQSPGFAVNVTPSVISIVGDTITLSYVVRVAATARDSLLSFMVDAPGVVRVEMPGPRPTWTVGTRWRARRVAEWGKLDHLFTAGSSTPPLRFTAAGLLDVVRYWAEADVPLDSVVTEAPPDSSVTSDTTVTIRGSSGWTVGVGALPTDRSPAALVTRLSALIDRVCDLAWIDNYGICNSLRAKARPQAGPLRAMLNELSAQRGKHVNEDAYNILSRNAQYILNGP